MQSAESAMAQAQGQMEQELHKIEIEMLPTCEEMVADKIAGNFNRFQQLGLAQARDNANADGAGKYKDALTAHENTLLTTNQVLPLVQQSDYGANVAEFADAGFDKKAKRQNGAEIGAEPAEIQPPYVPSEATIDAMEANNKGPSMFAQEWATYAPIPKTVASGLLALGTVGLLYATKRAEDRNRTAWRNAANSRAEIVARNPNIELQRDGQHGMELGVIEGNEQINRQHETA